MCVARSSPTCEPSRMDIREQRWQAVGFLRRDMRSDPRNDRCAPFATNRLVLGERTNRSYRVVPPRFPARQSAATFLSLSLSLCLRLSFVAIPLSFNVQTTNTSLADRSSDVCSSTRYLTLSTSKGLDRIRRRRPPRIAPTPGRDRARYLHLIQR